MDIFFANDSVRNLLFHNRKDGSFEDVTFSSGVGYSEDGTAEAGMGVDAADYDNDGLLDIYVTHLDFELNRLYHNEGEMAFPDATMISGLGRTAILNSGFGTRFLDYDNDGRRDLLVVNGHVLDNVNLYRKNVEYAERKMLYHNRSGRFVNVSSSGGPAFVRPRVGRGLALGDYDNDGDLDVVVSNNNQAAELLRNDAGNHNPWLGIRLIGTSSNRDDAEYLRSDLIPAYKKAGVDGVLVSRRRFGTNARHWLIITFLDKMAELDEPHPLAKSLGEEKLGELRRKGGALIIRSERYVFSPQPDLTFVN